MKIPQVALNGSYLPATSSANSHYGNGSSYHDNLTAPDSNNNSPRLSPTRSFTEEHNLMVDMAVAKDKTPFLLATKANDNLQRALNRFMHYHEREKKLVNRMFQQEEQIYRKRVARCATALPRHKTKTINTIVEERAHDEEEDGEGKWAITKKQTLSSPFGKPRPKTAGGPVARQRIRTQLALPEEDEKETVELTYTFNSLFGDVQKHVRVPSVSDLSDNSDREDNDNGDPLSSHVKFPTPSREKRASVDMLTPILVSPCSRSSSASPRIFRRSASQEAYSELERKKSISGSQCGGSDSEETRKAGVVPDTWDSQEYVCENVFGNLSLQVHKDSRLNKVQVGGSRECCTPLIPGELTTPVTPVRRSSISEAAYRQLGRVKHYEINREDSRRLSGCSDSLYSASNSTLTYSHATEPGMAVNKAISFLNRLDKYASSKRSKLHEGLMESVAKNAS